MTERVAVRRPTAGDWEVLAGLWLDGEVRRYLGGVVSAAEAEGRLSATLAGWDARGFGMGTLELRSSGKLAGLSGLHPSEHGELEVSYMLFPDFWGRGLAREVVLGWLSYARDQVGAGEVVAVTQEANVRSCRLLEACGMEWRRSFEEFGAMQRLYSVSFMF